VVHLLSPRCIVVAVFFVAKGGESLGVNAGGNNMGHLPGREGRGGAAGVLCLEYHGHGSYHQAAELPAELKLVRGGLEAAELALAAQKLGDKSRR